MMLGNLEERADQLLEEGDMAGAETWAPDPETRSSGCKVRPGCSFESA
jgi:hypothetical protein